VRADQTPFKNSGACVSYAAHGGTLTTPKSAAQLLCESLGGVFAPGSGNTLWFCTYTSVLRRRGKRLRARLGERRRCPDGCLLAHLNRDTGVRAEGLEGASPKRRPLAQKSPSA
jgi:hypothetical protein